jgi:hypothetical protein
MTLCNHPLHSPRHLGRCRGWGGASLRGWCRGMDDLGDHGWCRRWSRRPREMQGMGGADVCGWCRGWVGTGGRGYDYTRGINSVRNGKVNHTWRIKKYTPPVKPGVPEAYRLCMPLLRHCILKKVSGRAVTVWTGKANYNLLMQI